MYNKEYYEAHKEQYKAKMKEYYESHKASLKAYRQANKESLKAYLKAWYKANREQAKAAHKEYYQAHKEEVKAWYEANKERLKEQTKEYKKSDINSLCQTKDSIRHKSRYILKKMNLHITGYEIHHCFGYEDPSKFIYCSKSLHLKIHQFLRDNNIDTSTDHWMAIRELVNDTDEFVYIKA